LPVANISQSKAHTQSYIPALAKPSETPSITKTFTKMMTRGVKQSDRLIIEDCQVGRRWAKKVVFNRVHFENQNINEVYFRTSNSLELLYKKEAG